MNKIISLSCLLFCIISIKAQSVNSHMIAKVENMIDRNDTFFINEFIDQSMQPKKMGSFYLELADSLIAHDIDIEYLSIFSKSGAYNIIRKAGDMQYSNRRVSSRLKKDACSLLRVSIDRVFEQWLANKNDGSLLLKDSIDMMMLYNRIQSQIDYDPVSNFKNYILFGELYLAVEDYKSAQEYFMAAKEFTKQIETQEYSDISEIYCILAEANSNLESEGTILDMQSFLTNYYKLDGLFDKYEDLVDSKRKKSEDDSKEDDSTNNISKDLVDVSLEESSNWLSRLNKIKQRVFTDFYIVAEEDE